MSTEYIKTSWQDGDIITADKMNNIENGIKDVEDTATALKEDLDDVETALETKAEIDGYYEDMTVGDAEQLVSTVFTEDSTPYNFRTTGGSADVGDREYVDAVVGGTIAWNQMINHGNFDASGSWFEYACTYTFVDGVATVTPTDAISRIFQTRAAVLGHKYFMIATFKGTSGEGNAMLSWYGGVNVFVPFTGSWQTISMIVNNTFQTSGVWQLHYGSTSNANKVPYMVKDAMCFDLTQMLGATIADYIYSLEQATAGAGIAWLKKNLSKIFNSGYVPYNTGELVSVEGLSAHKTVGFNAWDVSTDNVGKSIGADGTLENSANYCVSDYIRVIPNTTYYFRNVSPSSVARTFAFYDANKNFISTHYLGGQGEYVSGTETMPTNAHYVRVQRNKNATEVCCNLSWDGEKDGQYEPYVEHTYALDNSLTLRGIPKLDAQNTLYYDGDEYLPDGTVNRRFNVVTFDGSEDEFWMQYGGARFYINKSDFLPDFSAPDSSVVANLFTNQGFVVIDKNHLPSTNNGTKYISGYDTGGHRFIVNFALDTLEEVKAYLAENPLTVIYPVDNPTTETAEPYQHVQICDDFGTEEFISTSPVPVGHNTRYAPNLRAKLEMSPDSPDGDGVYVVQQTNGENTYVPLGSTTVIQDILARLTALEGNTNEG